jgi:hypothetical protein
VSFIVTGRSSGTRKLSSSVRIAVISFWMKKAPKSSSDQVTDVSGQMSDVRDQKSKVSETLALPALLDFES